MNDVASNQFSSRTIRRLITSVEDSLIEDLFPLKWWSI